MILTEQAFGKLNLALDVLGRRPDGYHDMRMVMQSVDLCDTVTVETGTREPWKLDCYRELDGVRHRGAYPQDERNLAWRAADCFCRGAGIDPEGVAITICKRIPVQAGMAGGSADAAAVLRALNRGYGAPFTTRQLCRLAEQIGSDVPYCVLGGTALAEGRGEILTRLNAIPEVWFVLAKPEFSVSTPTLFRAIDAQPIESRPELDAMLSAIEAGDAVRIGALLKNVFQPVASSQYPVVDSICRQLLEDGALGAQMTGTGSVVFGMFQSQAQATLAAQRVKAYVPEVFVSKPV